jgi:hypothetical protein
LTQFLAALDSIPDHSVPRAITVRGTLIAPHEQSDLWLYRERSPPRLWQLDSALFTDIFDWRGTNHELRAIIYGAWNEV